MAVKNSNERFLRQIPLIGDAGQKKLHNARVLVAGAGGLGSAIVTYLSAAGVGHIRIVDEDMVEGSNLNRQILYREQDVGACKVKVARQMIYAFSHDTQVDAVCRHIDVASVEDLVEEVDLIVDGMDNFPTRFLLNRAAISKNIPFIHGAVNGFYGQVTTIIPGITPCLRCIVPNPPEWEKPPIIGVTCGTIGCIEATEAIKYITGVGEILKNRLLLWDGLRGDSDTISVIKSPDCDDCGDPTVEHEMRRFQA